MSVKVGGWLGAALQSLAQWLHRPASRRRKRRARRKKSVVTWLPRWL